MKREDEERLQMLVEQKTFHELLAEEREFVLKLVGSEEEFTALIKLERMLLSDQVRSTVIPDQMLLTKLTRKLKETSKRESTWHLLINIKIPAYATVLLILFFSGIVGLYYKSSATPKPVIQASSITKKDTIYFTKVDTVFKEKIIYRHAKFQVRVVDEIRSANEAGTHSETNATGVTMKDKEELNKLLVSGSD